MSACRQVGDGVLVTRYHMEFGKTKGRWEEREEAWWFGDYDAVTCQSQEQEEEGPRTQLVGEKGCRSSRQVSWTCWEPLGFLFHWASCSNRSHSHIKLGQVRKLC